jgi:tRNA A37 threonylcarbamoyladenosine modification protein TsaB
MLCALVAGSDGEMLDGEVFAGSLAQSIPAAINRYLRSDCTGVVVVRGPGSYTGIRAGIAAAKALSGTRALPVYTTDRLTAMAAVKGLPFTASVLEAGRGGIYVQTFKDGVPPLPASSPSHQTASEWTPGAGHQVVSDFEFAGGPACGPLDILAAATKVALAGGAVDLSQISALYVSQPDFVRNMP